MAIFGANRYGAARKAAGKDRVNHGVPSSR
jgi:hypothetical protein